MLIFLYGQDTYRMREKLKELVEEYKKVHKNVLTLKSFEEENLNFDEIKNEAKISSIFQEKKLIIFKNVLSLLKNEPRFMGLSNDLQKSDDIVIFLEEKDFNGKNELVKFLMKNAKSQEFQLLNNDKLKNWVKKEFENYEVKIDSTALEKLINFVGNDLWQMSNEIRKLVNYKRGEKIKKEDVALLVKPKIESDIFATINSIAARNKKEALSLIHKHLEKGDNPLYLLSMINFQFRNLLIIKDLIQKYRSPYTLSKVTNLHPYIIKKSYSLTQKFTIQELKKIYQKIFQVDLAIKTGRVSPEAALDLFLAGI